MLLHGHHVTFKFGEFLSVKLKFQFVFAFSRARTTAIAVLLYIYINRNSNCLSAWPIGCRAGKLDSGFQLSAELNTSFGWGKSSGLWFTSIYLEGVTRLSQQQHAKLMRVTVTIDCQIDLPISVYQLVMFWLWSPIWSWSGVRFMVAGSSRAPITQSQ